MSAGVYMAKDIDGGWGTTHGSQVSLSTVWNKTRLIRRGGSTLNRATAFCALSS